MADVPEKLVEMFHMSDSRLESQRQKKIALLGPYRLSGNSLVKLREAGLVCGQDILESARRFLVPFWSLFGGKRLQICTSSTLNGF